MNEEPGFAQLTAAVQRDAGSDPFDLAVILGSGLGALTAEMVNPAVFSYRDHPCFHLSQIPGHDGALYAGRLFGWRVLVFAGRQHIYQGCTAFATTLPVRVAYALGCRRLLLTNATGGIREDFIPGDFMFIADHLNLLGDNPLRGLPDSFVDLSRLYRRDLFPPLDGWAQREGIAIHSGVLAALPGPSYETPAEIGMLRILGADAVSMSTIPEALMGKYLGMDVAGLSLIANRAAGMTQALSHAEVLAVARRAAGPFVRAVGQLLIGWRAADALPESGGQ